MSIGAFLDARHAIRFLLTRIGSWTNARWDQHLRSEVGDVRAQKAIDWIEHTFQVKEYALSPISQEDKSLVERPDDLYDVAKRAVDAWDEVSNLGAFDRAMVALAKFVEENPRS